MTDDDTMALLARVRWLEAEVQRLIDDTSDLLDRVRWFEAQNQRLIDQLEQAEADRDTLAAEVEAWRHNDNVHECSLMTELEFLHKRSVKAHDRACEAAQRTDESGALQRAKEVK